MPCENGQVPAGVAICVCEATEQAGSGKLVNDPLKIVSAMSRLLVHLLLGAIRLCWSLVF